MRKLFFIYFLILATFSFAQNDYTETYFHDVSVDYGLFASLNSDAHQNLVGNKISFQSAYFYSNKFGIRSGISFIKNLEGTNKFYEVPIQFVYRTPIDKSFFIGGTVDSIEDLILKIILGLVPRQADFHIGSNLGYIEPDNNLGLSSINGGPFVQRGFQTEQRFVTTVDLGMRLHYKIRRFGIVAAPNVSYLVTENFKYYSDTGSDHGYKPKWFMNISIGLVYQF
ncbi:hypothetical protein ACFLQ3_01865 [Bacteroidota bacterium]